MSTHTVGILFGAPIPAGLDLYGDDGPGLFDLYETAACPDGADAWEWGCANIPRTDGNYRVIGFLVVIAAGNAAAYGAGEVSAPVGLDTLTTTEPYETLIANARARWDAFAAWAMAKQCVTFDVPRLWIATVEVS